MQYILSMLMQKKHFFWGGGGGMQNKNIYFDVQQNYYLN